MRFDKVVEAGISTHSGRNENLSGGDKPKFNFLKAGKKGKHVSYAIYNTYLYVIWKK